MIIVLVNRSTSAPKIILNDLFGIPLYSIITFRIINLKVSGRSISITGWFIF